MDSTDHDDREPAGNQICRLEWIALAMDAARRYKEEQRRRERGELPRDERESD